MGTLAVEDLTLQVEGPLRLESDGAGYAFPEGSRIHSCASISGRADHGVEALGDQIYLRLDGIQGSLSLDGSFPVVIHAGSNSGDDLQGTLAFLAAGNGPWTGSPLRVDTGADGDAGDRDVDAAVP